MSPKPPTTIMLAASGDSDSEGWDAAIAAELRALPPPSQEQSLDSTHYSKPPPAEDAAHDALAVLTAAMRAREQLATRVAASLQDMAQLSSRCQEQQRHACTAPAAGGSPAAGVAEAVEALQLLTASGDAATPTAASVEAGAAAAAAAAVPSPPPPQQTGGTEGLSISIPASSSAADAPAAEAPSVDTAQSAPGGKGASGSWHHETPVGQAPHAPAAAPPEAATAVASLSQPHTPDTQDTRQRAQALAAALGAAQQRELQGQGAAGFMHCMPAGAADAALAAAHAAAAAAEQARRQQHEELQQVLQQQAAAAAARGAAQAAQRHVLQQQAEAAARAYMAAWRIHRAWLAYRGSTARAQRIAAAVLLQAVVKGAAARQLLRQMQARRRMLTGLEAAVQSGSLEAVQQAAAAAAEAGCVADGQQALQRLHAAAAAAARDLRQASAAGSHAAFAAAAAAAGRFSALQALCESCRVVFGQRQQAAAEALAAAVAFQPLAAVQCAVDSGLELGLHSRDLAAALDAAATRDAQALARLAAAVTAAATAVDRLAARAAAAPADGGQPNEEAASAGGFNAAEFDAALSSCRQLGKATEAAAAEAALARCREQGAQALQVAAGSGRCAATVQRWAQLCEQLQGLQLAVAAAMAALQQRQQALAGQLQGTAADDGSSAADVLQLLRQAEELGVSPAATSAAQQKLQERQAAAAAALQQAAEAGSQSELQAAVAAAQRLQLDGPSISRSCAVMQQRRQAAAAELAWQCSGIVVAVAAAAAGDQASSCTLRQLLALLQQQVAAWHQQASNECWSGFEQQLRSTLEGCAAALAAGAAGAAAGEAASGWVKAFVQQGDSCMSLGLADNVLAALEALHQACLLQLRNGASCVASFRRLLECSASSSVGTPSQQLCWEEGVEQQQQEWHSMADSAATAVPWLPAQMQVAPWQALQQQWAVSLCCAGAHASSSSSSATAAAAVVHNRPSSGHQRQPPPSVQPQHTSMLHTSMLQWLLAANAAAPLDQLTHLDLSLEQLPGLCGLAMLCPQLQSLALNINGLTSLQELQGCSALQSLSAQDNRLDVLPDISCHPQMTSLLLDNNSLTRLLPPAGASSSSSSSGGSSTAHARLQVLSVINNQLSSLVAPGGGSSSSATNDAPSNATKPVTLAQSPRVAAWLPGLAVLRLSGNTLRGLSGLQGLSSLRHLEVSRNRLTSLEGLAGCSLLQHLDASHNQLAAFPSTLHLPLLQHLSLSANALTAWPSLPPLPHLRRLSLSDNQLRQLQPLHGLWQLTALEVGFNELLDLRANLESAAAAPQLCELGLHDNAGFVQQWQQQRGRHQPEQWPAAALGDAAAFEAWYRQCVAARLPWVTLLDNKPLQPEQQQEHVLDGLGARAAAAGRLDAGSSRWGLALLQQLRSGTKPGLPLQQQQQWEASACSGAACRHRAALLAASAWLPHLVGSSWQDAAAPQQLCTQAAGDSRAPRGLPCSHLQEAAAHSCLSTCRSSSSCGWLKQLEAAWCCSTRQLLVQQQVAQQPRACTSPGEPAELLHAAIARGQHSNNSSSSGALAQQQLQQLQEQPCSAHQHVLMRHACFAQLQQQHRAGFEAAVLLLQSSWRAHAARQQYRLVQQQHKALQAATGAAVVVQTLWRGRRARQAAAQVRQHQQQRVAAARAAAAVMIQAAVRGRKVRQRLKAALAAARMAAGRQSHDDEELPAWSEDYFRGHELLGESSSSASWLLRPTNAAMAGIYVEQAASKGSASLPLVPHAAAAVAAAADTPAASSDSQAAEGARLAAEASTPLVPAAGKASSAAFAAAPRAASAAHEARIGALMSEWGFADRATAEAYLKRQKHTFKAATRHKLEQQLTDPAVRLKRVLSSAAAASASVSCPQRHGSLPGGRLESVAVADAAAGHDVASPRGLRKVQSDAARGRLLPELVVQVQVQAGVGGKLAPAGAAGQSPVSTCTSLQRLRRK